MMENYFLKIERILREIKQPVAEVAELKPEKLKSIDQTLKEDLLPQNTPDVTASRNLIRLSKQKMLLVRLGEPQISIGVVMSHKREQT